MRRRSVVIAGAWLACLLPLTWFLATDLFFRAWTVFELFLVPVAGLEIVRARSSGVTERSRALLFPVILLFAICATARIFLNLAPLWYGFVLTLPVYVLIVFVIFAKLPEWRVMRRSVALLTLPLFVVISIRNLVEQRARYGQKIYPIETPRGTFFDSSRDRAAVLNDFLSYLEGRHATAVLMIPEGLTLNYAAGVEDPLSFHTFSPMEMSPETERRALEEIERKQPRYIALNTQNPTDLGFRGFGIDFGVTIFRYVQAHYEVEKAWRTPTFSVFLFRYRG